MRLRKHVESKNKFLEIVKPERVVIANFWGSSARTTKVNSFQLFDPNEQVDFVIWSRADNHMHVKVTDMNINYTPNGVFSTFPNGMPTQINLTLNFRELALLTKDKVKDGL
mgnify:CR=1 FL=1